jgi:hypothetical protein
MKKLKRYLFALLMLAVTGFLILVTASWGFAR